LSQASIAVVNAVAITLLPHRRLSPPTLTPPRRRYQPDPAAPRSPALSRSDGIERRPWASCHTLTLLSAGRRGDGRLALDRCVACEDQLLAGSQPADDMLDIELFGARRHPAPTRFCQQVMASSAAAEEVFLS
jgi:hypothetical protein